MKITSFLLIGAILLSLGCSDQKSSKTEKSNKGTVKAKFRTDKPQEPPEREIIDMNEEDYTVEQILKIDEEIPVLEIICSKEWKQSDFDKLSKLQMIDTLRLENMDSSKLNLSFIKSLKSMKVISFKGGNSSLDTIKSLAGSSIEKVDCANTNISKDGISSIQSDLGNITVSF